MAAMRRRASLRPWALLGLGLALLRAGVWERSPQGFVLGARPFETRPKRSSTQRLRAAPEESMTVSELAQHLRKQGLQVDAERADAKAGHMLADLIEHLASSGSKQAPQKQPPSKSAANAQQVNGYTKVAAHELYNAKSVDEIFAELKALQPDVRKEDYFSEETGMWDVEGLEDDLELAQAAAPSSPAAKVTPPKRAAVPAAQNGPAALFAQLVALDPQCNKEDYYDAASNTWDVDGLEDDLRLAKAPVPAASAAAQMSIASAEEAVTNEATFAELLKVSPESRKEDYYNEHSGWDTEGLMDDLRVAKANLANMAPASPAAAGSASGSEGQALFAQLQSLEASASKEDYYDAEADFWDIEGLEDDLRLAKAQASQAQATPPKAEEASVGEKLFAELKALDSGAGKEDYFESASGFWDIEGLEDDLRLAKAAAAPAPVAPVDQAPATPTTAPPANQVTADERPKQLFLELQAVDPQAMQEDYYDAAGDFWDVTGLEDDLRLAKAAKASMQEEKVEEQPAPAPSAQPVAAAADGSTLLAELRVYQSDASKEDYFDEASGVWDIAGLESDLQLVKGQVIDKLEASAVKVNGANGKNGASNGAHDDKNGVNGANPASQPKASQPNGEKSPAELFAELQELDSSICKEDYYDDAADIWDVQGIKDDLVLLKNSRQPDPEGLLAELQRFAPGALRDDYYSEATKEWDLEGLEEDLRLSRARHPVFQR